MDRYKKLAEKETILHKELDELNQEMAMLSGELLDHPCDSDDVKMESIYQTDYVKRGNQQKFSFLEEVESFFAFTRIEDNAVQETYASC